MTPREAGGQWWLTPPSFTLVARDLLALEGACARNPLIDNSIGKDAGSHPKGKLPFKER